MMILWLVVTFVALGCVMLAGALASTVVRRRRHVHVYDQDLVDDAEIRRFLDEENPTC